VRAHREQSPGTPVLVRHHTPAGGVGDDGIDGSGCVEVETDGAAAVAQVLALLGSRVGVEDSPA
jgi:hypothetical protein